MSSKTLCDMGSMCHISNQQHTTHKVNDVEWWAIPIIISYFNHPQLLDLYELDRVVLDQNEVVCRSYVYIYYASFFVSILLLCAMAVDRWVLPQNDDVMQLKRFSCDCPFVRGIHRSPVDSPHKGTVTRGFRDVHFGVSLNKLMNKQSSCLWIETPIGSFDVVVMKMGNGIMGALHGPLFWFPILKSKSQQIIWSWGIHTWIIWVNLWRGSIENW